MLQDKHAEICGGQDQPGFFAPQEADGNQQVA